VNSTHSSCARKRRRLRHKGGKNPTTPEENNIISLLCCVGKGAKGQGGIFFFTRPGEGEKEKEEGNRSYVAGRRDLWRFCRIEAREEGE